MDECWCGAKMLHIYNMAVFKGYGNMFFNTPMSSLKALNKMIPILNPEEYIVFLGYPVQFVKTEP